MTIDELKASQDMLAVGAIPIHPGVVDYADTDGKIILYVRDEEEGRSCYISIEMYGELSRTYEVRYEDFEAMITKMMIDVAMATDADPFTQLLKEGN